MTNNRPISGAQVVQDRSKSALPGFLHLRGTRSRKRQAAILLSILAVLTSGYFTVSYFATHAMQDLADTCTERYELELENADIGPLPDALPRSLCECLASSLLDKNGIMRLALVDRGLLEPLALEPVTQKDASACIDALWVPNVELATGLLHE